MRSGMPDLLGANQLVNDHSMIRKWARRYAAFPAIVRVACSLDEERSPMAYGFHCVRNGEVVLAPAGRLGAPSLQPMISTHQRLIVAAYTMRLSKLSAPELDRALERPDDWGYLVFCLSRTESVLLSPEERASLVDSVIDFLCEETNADPLSMLCGGLIESPAGVISRKDARLATRSYQISTWFLVKCRLAVRAAVSTTLEQLLDRAHERCDHEQKLVAMF